MAKRLREEEEETAIKEQIAKVLVLKAKPKMAKKLTEEAKVVAISEIMIEVRRMNVNVKVKAKRE